MSAVGKVTVRNVSTVTAVLTAARRYQQGVRSRRVPFTVTVLFPAPAFTVNRPRPTLLALTTGVEPIAGLELVRATVAATKPVGVTLECIVSVSAVDG